MVSISACHADDPGSIPGRGVIDELFSWAFLRVFDREKFSSDAAIAQSGERQTEDLKVLGSIPGHGKLP